MPGDLVRIMCGEGVNRRCVYDGTPNVGYIEPGTTGIVLRTITGGTLLLTREGPVWVIPESLEAI